MKNDIEKIVGSEKWNIRLLIGSFLGVFIFMSIHFVTLNKVNYFYPWLCLVLSGIFIFSALLAITNLFVIRANE